MSFGKQGKGRHDLAGGAVTALKAIVGDEGLLQGLERLTPGN